MATSANRRKVWSIALGTCLLVLLASLTALQAFNLKFLNPATTEQLFVFTGLSIVAFILFVTILVLLVRNVLKLYADQRSRVMGTRLRTRMLWGAVLVSLLPIAFMSFFSYGLMNRAVDRWFSQPVTQMRDDSNRMALELSRYTTANARAEADSIASSLPVKSIASDKATTGSRTGSKPTPKPEHSRAKHPADQSSTKNAAAPSQLSRETIYNVLRQHEITLQNGFAIVYRDGRPFAAYHMPQRDGATAQLKTWFPEQERRRGERGHNRRGARTERSYGLRNTRRSSTHRRARLQPRTNRTTHSAWQSFNLERPSSSVFLCRMACLPQWPACALPPTTTGPSSAVAISSAISTCCCY